MTSSTDVLIIGAGASGAACAWSLADAGFNVICLEQGGWMDPHRYPTTHLDWEIHRQTDFHPNPNVRKLPEDYPVNETETPIAPLMYNAVGGSTIHWSAHFPRLHPSDFRVKTLDGVADDWPISYQDLEPYFDLNDHMMGVAGLQGDPAYPPKPRRQTPPLPLGTPANVLVKGFQNLGWHWWPSDTAINSQPYDGRPGCNNCGPCDLGCTIRAKASTDVTYWPKALSHGVLLKTRCRVRELTIDANGHANGAIYYDPHGNVQQVKADVVVMACNGIGTPRLLLTSQSGKHPNGLANSTGLVGKNLMFHPYTMITGFFNEPMEGYKGPSGCSITSHEFYETDRTRDFVRGYTFQVSRGTGPAHVAQGGKEGVRVPWGRKHREVFDSRFDRGVTIVVAGEDLPEESNQVTLDNALVDSDGIPSPKVNYQLSNNSQRMMEHGIKSAAEVLKASGAYDVKGDILSRQTGWHLLGTARMGDNPETSVVDKHGRSHDIKNLFVVDGSIWVTAGAVNPTSTIQAVALYISNFIKTNARHILD